MRLSWRSLVCAIMKGSARTDDRVVWAYSDELQTHERLRASRRSAGGYRTTLSRHRGGREASGSARRHWIREDIHGGQVDRAGEPPRSISRAQQDARRATVQ